MRKIKLNQIITDHGNKIKFAGIFIFIVAMLISIKTYTNYHTIIEAIEDVNVNIKNIEDEIAYSNNFLKAYLDSEYADYFLAHKSNILFNWERIIRFLAPIEEKEELSQKDPKLIQTPQESWQHFIKSKFKK